MSNSDAPRPYSPAKITVDEYERLARLFKDLFAEHPLIKWAIYLAGIGGLAETLHVLWLAFKYLNH